MIAFLLLFIMNEFRQRNTSIYGVMREYEFEDSWIKQLVVGPLFKPKEPLGFAKNGEFLLLVDITKYYCITLILKK